MPLKQSKICAMFQVNVNLGFYVFVAPVTIQIKNTGIDCERSDLPLNFFEKQ